MKPRAVTYLLYVSSTACLPRPQGGRSTNPSNLSQSSPTLHASSSLQSPEFWLQAANELIIQSQAFVPNPKVVPSLPGPESQAVEHQLPPITRAIHTCSDIRVQDECNTHSLGCIWLAHDLCQPVRLTIQQKPTHKATQMPTQKLTQKPTDSVWHKFLVATEGEHVWVAFLFAFMICVWSLCALFFTYCIGRETQRCNSVATKPVNRMLLTPSGLQVSDCACDGLKS